MLAAFAGVAVLSVASAATALAAAQTVSSSGTTGVCQLLPPAPSTPPPNPSPTGTPGPTGGGSQTITQLCVSVQAPPASVQPGQTATFVIDAWTVGGDASNVVVGIAATPTGFGTPAFSVCGQGDGTAACTIGDLKVNQTTQLEAQLAVPTTAASGTATLTATGTGSSVGATTTASATQAAPLTVVKPTPTPTPSPTPTKTSTGHKGHSTGSSTGTGSSSGTGGTGVGTGLTSPLSGLQPLGATGSGGGSVVGTGPSNLFPTIGPSTGTGTASSALPSAQAHHSPYHARTVADTLPLNTSQLGGQVAGLVVLAIGIVIAVARVSLRKPRAEGK